MAAYCERFSSETAQLVKYGAAVRALAQRGANWKFYHENFRMLRQRETIPWDQIHSELWLRASVPKAKEPLPSKSTTEQRGPLFPKGFCWTFLKGGNCTGCEFKHQCFTCRTACISKTRVVKQKHLHPLRYPHQSRLTDLPFISWATAYEDQFQNNLIDGFTVGFRLLFQGPYNASCDNNLISAMQVVDSKLSKEMQSGCIQGPFNYPPFSNLRVSPLGVIRTTMQGPR